MRRFFRFGRAKDIEREVDEELAFHLEEHIRAMMAGGMSRAQARDEALRRLGDLPAVREDLLAVDARQVRNRDLRERLDDWLLDFRHAARALRRTPGLTLTIAVLLAIGVGVNAAMFGILDRLLLRAAPHLKDPAQLLVVRVAQFRHGKDAGYGGNALASYPDIENYATVPGLSAVAGYSWPMETPLDGDESRTATRSLVTARFFEVVGTKPIRGRVFDAGDSIGPPVAVISYDFWRRRFDRREDAIGAKIELGSVAEDGRAGHGGIPYTIIGIMPEGFSGIELSEPDAWTLADHGGMVFDWRHERHTLWLIALARRRAGVSDRQLVAELVRSRAEVERELASFGSEERIGIGSVIPGRRSDFAQDNYRLAIAVGIVSALLLLIAVANVTNLLLVRAVTRVREFAVRSALGAGAGRLLRLVTIESLVLAVLGGLGAGLVGYASGNALRGLLLPGYRFALPPLGLMAGAFAAALSLGIGLVTGLLPGLLAGRDATLGALRTGIQRQRGARSRVRGALVAVQVGLSVVLCVGTGLFASSLVRAMHADRGLPLRQMVLARLGVPPGNAAAQAARAEELAGLVRRAPGVVDVAITSAAPLDRLDFSTLKAEGGDSVKGALSYRVGPGFFRAGALRLLAGRGFDSSDAAGAERVAIVDSVFAAKAWHGASPLGRCVEIEGAPGCVRVVGVAAYAMPTNLQEPREPQIYTPIAQTPPAEFSLLVRINGDVDQGAETAWRALHAELPELKRSRIQVYARMIEPQIRPWRVGVTLFSIAAALALLLSSIGTYAIMSFSVRQRTGEFGIRRALGASAHHILGLLGRECLGVAGAGVAAGIMAAWLLARFIGPMLYEVSPRDPAILGGAAALLLASAIAAALGAGRLALRVDPREALQAD